MNRSNGGYIGILKEDASVYPFSGVYPLYEQQENKLAGLWPDRADSNFANTSLLLKTTSQSTRSTTAIDSSVNNLAATRSGSPSTGWISPYQTSGYWSNYFGATGQYLSVPYSSVFNLTGDFTVEFWINCGNLPSTTGSAAQSYERIFSFGTYNAANSFGLEINSNDTGRVRRFVSWYNGTSNDLSSNNAVSPGIWYHVALVRSSTTITFYLNGISTGTITGASAAVNTSQAFYIASLQGFEADASAAFNGYISNFRIVKGTAVYTANFTPSTSPLTAISGTSLLTCQNNRFIDNSTNNFTVTSTGTPQTTPYWYPSTFSTPAASVGGGYFNGTTDYLTTPANAAFAFGTGDFTVECWIFITYPLGTAGQGRGVLVSNRSVSSSSTSLVLQHYNSKIYFGTPSTDLIISTTTLTINNWTHIAVSRSSGTLRLFVNGVLDTTVASNITNFSDTNAFAIGTDGLYLGYYFTGQISNLRLVKGTAVYTGNFTPPTDFLTTTGGTYPSTSNVVTSIASSNTSLLLNLADSNYTSFANTSNNNAFVDSGPYAFPVTRSGTPTQGSITPYWPDGYWSNYFNGSSDYLSSTTASTVLQFGTNPYTVEGWVYQTSRSGTPFICGGAFSGNGFQVAIDSSGFIYASIPGVSNLTAATIAIPLNTWTHFALVRTSTSTNGFTYYINGTAAGTITDANNYSGTATSLNVATTNNSSLYLLTGYLSNLRIVKGVAVYTGAFTPPTSPLAATQSAGTNIAAITGTATSLLTCQSNRFKDNSTNTFAITPSGTPRVQSFQPFPPTASYTTAAYGGSGYFNGSTDYLQINTGIAMSGVYTFTAESWIYIIGTGGYIFSTYNSVANEGWAFNISTTAVIYGATWHGAGNFMTFTTTIPTNAWTHVAVVGTGTGANNLKCYVNGSLVGTLTFAGTWPEGVKTVIANSGSTSYPAYTNGYITDARLVKGVALYTGNFTVPTAPLTNSGSTSATAYANTSNVNTSFGASSTSLLQNFTNIGVYDATTQNDLITISGAQVSNTAVKWAGSTSMRFNGSTDYLYYPGNQIFNFTSSDFTVESWVYLNALPTSDAWPTNYSLHMVIGTVGTPSLGDGIGFIIGQTKLLIQNNDTQYASTSVHNLAPGAWNHLAYVRYGNNFYFYVNGASKGFVAFSSSVGTGSGTYIGCETGQGAFLNGYMQDFRVTRTARYTTSFTPPTLPFLTL
jgi:hypothetical protein